MRHQIFRERVRDLIQDDKGEMNPNTEELLVEVFMQGAISIRWIPQQNCLGYTYVPEKARETST